MFVDSRKTKKGGRERGKDGGELWMTLCKDRFNEQLWQWKRREEWGHFKLGGAVFIATGRITG